MRGGARERHPRVHVVADARARRAEQAALVEQHGLHPGAADEQPAPLRVDAARHDPLENHVVAALGGRATRAEERLELALGERAAAAQRLEAAVVAQQRERRHPLDAVLPRVLPRHPDPEEDVEGAHVPRDVGQQRLGRRQVAAVAVARRVRREEHQHVVQPPLDLPPGPSRRGGRREGQPVPAPVWQVTPVDQGRAEVIADAADGAVAGPAAAILLLLVVAGISGGAWTCRATARAAGNRCVPAEQMGPLGRLDGEDLVTLVFV